MDAVISVQLMHQARKLLLCRFLRQRVLDRKEAALLGHAAFCADIGMTCGIVADDNDGSPVFLPVCS